MESKEHYQGVFVRYLLLHNQFRTLNLAIKINTHFSPHSAVGQMSTQDQLGSLLRVSHGQNHAISQLGSYLLPWSFRLLTESCLLGLRFPFSCWLSAGCHSQLPDATHSLHHLAPSIFKPAVVCQSLCSASPPCPLLCTLLPTT